MKSYPPTHVDPRDSEARRRLSEPPPEYQPPSDEQLRTYVDVYWRAFRAAAETFFGDVVEHLPLYSQYPFATTIVRFGQNGVIFGHAPADEPSVRVLRPADFEPPLQSLNIFEIQERIAAPIMSFNFLPVSYDREQAEQTGTRLAFEQALNVFWHILEPAAFEALCNELLIAEDVRVETTSAAEDGFDLFGTIYFDEPGEFVREERWAFELKHPKADRPFAEAVRMLEERLQAAQPPLDTACLVTTGDLTSIGRRVAVANPQIRIWDRAVLDGLLHKHHDVMKKYFQPYAQAVEDLLEREARAQSRESVLREQLLACPPGREAFRQYEDLGVEVISYLFDEQLGEPRVQSRTSDGVERRDAVTRNNRLSRFFQRIAERFNADFVVWDFKNYSQPITLYFTLRGLRPLAAQVVKGVDQEGRGNPCAGLRPALGAS